MFRRLFLPLPVLVLALACGAKSAEPATSSDPVDATADVAALTDTAAPEDIAADVQTDVAPIFEQPAFCVEGGWSARPFAPGPYGVHRHDVAGDFSLPLADGSTWKWSENYLGCESVMFVPDTIAVSDLNKVSIWTKDLANLLKKSPRNVQWFFVSRMSGADAQSSISAMQDRLTTVLNNLSEADAAHWLTHAHVVAEDAGTLSDWPGEVLQGHGAIGFAIDRFQRIRGAGMLADVSRTNASKDWPWDANLAYAAHEPIMYNAEVPRWEARQGEVALIVPAWTGQTIEGFAEMEVTLTTAEVAKYDSLEIEVEQRCPKADQPEPGNCGAWDYIAWLGVQDGVDAGGKPKWLEVARFITSYHRETHWVVDATPMLPLFQKGGVQRLHWEWAPEWNKQPTITHLNLRFIKRGAVDMPTMVTKLWDGGAFTSQFAAEHPDRTVTIPAGAKRVNLWALITGHGSAEGTQCAEFCNHQHVFGAGGKTWKKEHKEAGSSNKCMANMDKGMTPNQGGTWWFGRGGWCPGMQVDPWVADLTEVAKPGQALTLSYQGLLAGKAPPDGSANIDGAVWLVVYE